MDVSAAVMLMLLLVCPQIRYWRQHEREAAADRVRTAGLETTARVSGLRPSTRYHVAVLAYNSAGTGPPSPRTTVTTRKPRTATVITHAHHVVVVSFSCIRTSLFSCCSSNCRYQTPCDDFTARDPVPDPNSDLSDLCPQSLSAVSSQ